MSLTMSETPASDLRLRRADLPWLVALTLAYVLLTKLGVTYLWFITHGSLVWLPNGLALAALLVGGRKYWPAIFLGALLGLWWVGCPPELSRAQVLTGNLGGALGKTLGPFLVVGWLRHVPRFDAALNHARDYWWLFLLGTAGGLVNATIGGGTLWLAGVNELPITLGRKILNFWMGDALAIVLVVPLLLVWRRPPSESVVAGRAVEATVGLGLAGLTGQFIFVGWQADWLGDVPLGYLAFVFVLWSAVRFERRMVVGLLVLFALQGLYGAARGVGFFSHQPTMANWLFLLTLSTIGITASLLFHAVKRAERALRRSNLLLDASQATAKVGGWELDLGTNQLFWTAETYRIHDTSPEEFNPTVDAGVGYFLPESRRIISTALQAAMERGEGYDLVLETLTTKGRRIDVRTTCAVTLHAGRPAKLTGIFQDITARKRDEQALAASDAQLRHLMQNLSVGIVVHGPDTRILLHNQTALALLGLSGEQMLGKVALDPAWCFVREDKTPMPVAEYPVTRVIATRDPVHDLILGILRPLTNDCAWVLVNASPEFASNGQLQQVVVTFADITARKQTESQLRLLEASVAQLNDAVIITEADLLDAPGPRIVFVNEATERLTGYTRAELIGQSPRRLQGPKTDRAELDRIGAALRERKSVHAELINYTKAGTEYWIELNITPVLSAAGVTTHFVAIERDVTARKAAAEALQASEGRWRFALEGAGDGVWDWDVPTSTVFFSKRYKEMLGYAEDEIGTGLDEWSSRVHPEDMPRVMADLQPHLDGKTAVYANEHRVRCKDGGYKWILARGMVIARDAEGRPLRVVGTHADITDRKYGEEERLRNLSLQQMMSSASPMGYLVVDNRTDEIRFFNKRFCEIWGIEHLADRMERGELKNRDIIPDCLPMLADVPAFAASCVLLQFEASRVTIEDEIPFTTGRMIRRYSTQLRGADDRYYGRFYLFEDVTRDKQAELREVTHSRTMTALVGGAPLAEVLTTLVRGVEAEHPGTLGSVLLLDTPGTHLLIGAAPSLPAFYNEAIHGVAIGPAVGSFGTAAFTGERVLVADIQTDPLWTDFKALAAQAGLASCWSEPIRGTRGQVVGTFAFYHAQPRVPNEAEIGTIVASAQLAAVAIERTQQEAALRASEQEYRALFEASPNPLALNDDAFRIVALNAAFVRTFGYTTADIPTLAEWWPKAYPDADYREWVATAWQERLQKAQQEGTAFEPLELTVRCQDDTRRTVLARAATLTGAVDGRHLVTLSDITVRKQAEAEILRLNAELEQRVRDRTAELHVVNQELEAFSYSVSHDLRAPLRHLTGFAELLQRNDRAKLDDQARRHITFISESAVRMGQLIDDLLAFSRSGRTELRQQPVNLDALVQQVIQGLHPDTRGRRIAWHIAPLPGVNADATLLRAALTNLFSNALKFTQSRDEATLHMGCTENEREHVFFIRDNGVGFDMQYVEKLFGVFQRLHATEEFEGTGIGLANVRRIITRHGGRTWAESVLGEGATFYFSLPKSTEHTHTERKAT